MPRQAIKIEQPQLRLSPDLAEHPFRWRELFDSDGPVEVEIGIGKGRFLLAAAEARPEVNHLGIEWANKYLRIAEERAARAELSNVRFARLDARELVERAMPDSSVDTFYVFYPDPWPKKRHQKRRFLLPRTIEHLARTLVPDGQLHAATDHADYWQTIEAGVDAHPAFERLETFGGERFPLPVDQPLTNFEEKYRVQGRRRFRASWRRLPSAPWACANLASRAGE